MPHIDVDVPSAVIVATGAFLGQTGTTNTFTLFTPTANGMFRVSTAMSTTGSFNVNSVAVSWTGGMGTGPFESVMTPGGNATVFAFGGTPIQVIVTEGAGATFDLHWTVEQLQ